MNYKSLRTQKELINMRENARVDWRAELNEEHPYVQVMPQKGGKKDKAKMAKKAVETTKEVREGAEVISEISDKRVNNMLKKRDKQVDKALDDNRRIGQSRNQWLSGVSDKMKKSDRAQEAAMRRKQRLAMKEENVADRWVVNRRSWDLVRKDGRRRVRRDLRQSVPPEQDWQH